jgi:hypothetical protein
MLPCCGPYSSRRCAASLVPRRYRQADSGRRRHLPAGRRARGKRQGCVAGALQRQNHPPQSRNAETHPRHITSPPSISADQTEPSHAAVLRPIFVQKMRCVSSVCRRCTPTAKSSASISQRRNSPPSSSARICLTVLRVCRMCFCGRGFREWRVEAALFTLLAETSLVEVFPTPGMCRRCTPTAKSSASISQRRNSPPSSSARICLCRWSAPATHPWRFPRARRPAGRCLLRRCAGVPDASSARICLTVSTWH